MEELKWPEITEATPLEEVKRIHQQIWDYVIEHGKKPDTPYYYDCVACEYDKLSDRGCCKHCPILWPVDEFGDRYCCAIPSDSGLYDRWTKAKGEEKTKLARQIRDLLWKFEIEKE